MTKQNSGNLKFKIKFDISTWWVNIVTETFKNERTYYISRTRERWIDGKYYLSRAATASLDKK